MILATQTVDDFASADLLRTVVESCPTKLLLANPALDRRQYAELFQLNEMELDLLAGLVPRQQILLKRPDLAKVLTLTVDPKSYWIYTNTPVDNERVADDVSRVRLRGGPRSARGVCVSKGGASCRVASSVAGARLCARWMPSASSRLDAQATGIREVSASERSLIPLQTRLRYTTMIVLPEGEEILDVICGDRDFWVISATQNIAHVKPAKEGAATNLNLVTASGDGLLVPADREERRATPDLKVYVNADPNAPTGQAEVLQRRAGRAACRPS